MGGKKAEPTLTQGQAEVLAIQKKLRHFTLEKESEFWLRPDFPELSEVLGDPDRGIPYGKVYEICGRYSGGKSATAMELAAMAQADGAHVAWMDHESSWDNRWAQVRGLDTDRVAVFQPRVVPKGKNDVRLLTAEEMYEELDLWVRSKLAQDPKVKMFVGIDSAVAIVPETLVEKGLENRQRGVHAAFLSKMLNQWTPKVFAYNIMMVIINQIRVNPGTLFGDPEYRPGGNALDHYTAVVVKVKRPRGKGKGFVLASGGKKIGIKGTIINIKNKVGGMEESVVGFKIYKNKRAKFVNVKEVE